MKRLLFGLIIMLPCFCGCEGKTDLEDPETIMVIDNSQRYHILSDFVETAGTGNEDVDYQVYAYFDRYDTRPEVDPDIYASRSGDEGIVIIKKLAGYGDVKFEFSSVNKIGLLEFVPDAFSQLDGNMSLDRREKGGLIMNLCLEGSFKDGRKFFLSYYRRFGNKS